MSRGRVFGPLGCYAIRLQQLTQVALRGTNNILDCEVALYQLSPEPSDGLSRAWDLVTAACDEWEAATRGFRPFNWVLDSLTFSDNTNIQFAPCPGMWPGAKADARVMLPAAASVPASFGPYQQSGDHDQTVFRASATPALVMQLAAAASVAAGRQPGLQGLALWFQFGKTRFIKLDDEYCSDAVSQSSMEALRHRTDFSDDFSTRVLSSTAGRLRDVLTGRGLKQISRKLMLAVHLEDLLTLSTRKGELLFEHKENGELAAGAMRLSSVKAFVVTSVEHGETQLDCRLQLVAQDVLDEVSILGARLLQVRNRLVGYQLTRSASGAWQLPPIGDDLQTLRLGLKSCQFKSITLLEGRIPEGEATITMRISIASVQGSAFDDGDTDSIRATEVTGSCPELDSALEELRSSEEAQRPDRQARVADLTCWLLAALQALTHAMAAAESAAAAAANPALDLPVAVVGQ